MNKKNRKPAIRFKAFNDPWEQRKLSSLCSLFTDGDWIESKDQSNFGIRLIQTGNIGITEFIEKIKSRKWISENTFNRLHCEAVFPGDILISRLPDPAGRACIVPNLKEKMITAVDCTIARVDAKFCASFLIQSLSTSNYFSFVNTCLAGGTRQRISRSNLSNYEVSIPSKKIEQKQIGQYFKLLDSLITLHQRKLDKLQNVKKACLEKMFPQNGESVPRIRFKGFTDTWEQRKLGELSSSFDYGLNAAAKAFDGENKYIRITDIDDESRNFTQSNLSTPDTNLEESGNYLLQKGDIVFARTGASVGKSYIYKPSDGRLYYAGFLIRARIKPQYCSEFIFQNTLTEKYRKFVYLTSQRSGQPGVNAQEYSSYELLVPQYAEQEKIGTLFRKLDTLITLHQRKLDKLKNLKKACLEKMFV